MAFVDKFFGDHLQYMAAAMGAVSARQQVLADNIANAGTPNFVPQTVAFEDQFRQVLAEKFGGEATPGVALEGSDPEHITGGGINLASFSPAVTEQGGPVDLHQEMVKLAQNQILFNVMSDQAAGVFLGTKYVIENFGR